jgi:hypothetical protein
MDEMLIRPVGKWGFKMDEMLIVRLLGPAPRDPLLISSDESLSRCAQ